MKQTMDVSLVGASILPACGIDPTSGCRRFVKTMSALLPQLLRPVHDWHTPLSSVPYQAFDLPALTALSPLLIRAKASW
jgi:hypothetical protein